MLKIFGKILNTLQYNVDKDINETLYQNEVFLASKWSYLEKSILRWSQRHRFYIALMVIISVLIVVNLVVWKGVIGSIAISYFPHWRKLIEWQGIFLAGQLTIVGVVYPLVIGLIGVLFQNKSAKKIIFPIYQMYSGFMFAGLSGLFLSIFIIVGYFFSASLAPSTYVAICLTSALWLTFNVLLTSWFFSTTFLMLDDAKRDRLIVRFTMHELCEFDIRKRLKKLLLHNAIQNKYLFIPDERLFKVRTYKLSDDKYKEICKPSKTPLEIYNVSFRLINTVIRFESYKLGFTYWVSSLWLSKWFVAKGLVGWNFKLNEGAEFVVQPIWYSRPNPRLSLIKYSGLNLSRLSKLLIRLSFSTKQVEDKGDKSLTSMIQAVIGSTHDALREKNIGEFKSSLDNIVKWHIEIASALGFINDSNQPDNWLLLPTTSFFSRRYLDEIMSEYYQVSKLAVELIPDNKEFYGEVLYLHKRIFSRREDLVEEEGFKLIQGNYFNWVLLMEWRSFSFNTTDMMILNKYEDILYDFVGSWESWLDYIGPREMHSENIKQTLPLLITHLEFTAQTAITALRYDNFEAAGWGVDMLNNWIKKVSSRELFHEKYRWNSELVTHRILFESSNIEPWKSILKGDDFKLIPAFDIALKNAAFDLRVITACYILLKPKSDKKDSINKYIKALLSGAAIHPTGTINGTINRTTGAISNCSDLLGAFIRQRDYAHYGEGSYGSWLSKVLESFSRVNEQKRVSGRIYSGWGRNDVCSMNKAYVEIAISLSTHEWQLAHKWFDIIFSATFSHMDQKTLIEDLQTWLKIAEEIDGSILMAEEELTSNIENFKTSVQKVIEQVKNRQHKIVNDAEVDQELLTYFGKVCSESLIAVSNSPLFPIKLFKRFSTNLDITDQKFFQVYLIDYAKEKIAVGLEENRTINEEDSFKRIINNDIKVNILRELLRYTITDCFEYDNAESNIIDVLELAKHIKNPIMFVGDDNLKKTLHKASYDQRTASNNRITFIDGYGNDYLCHIGAIEVFRMSFTDVNHSLLTSKDIFEHIKFAEVSEKQLIKLKYVAYENNESLGNLYLQYWMDVNLTEGMQCFKTTLNITDGDR
ncbi:hypothetical protein [Psychromonas aquatilis]|uniref:Uncharacterized protein n=1 Tax=Psychromonas aquatilis TaxID=2005072 RepID=A0ABU9GS53_9GAMM